MSAKMPTKICGACRKRKPVFLFYQKSATSDGRDNICMTCRKARNDGYRERNRVGGVKGSTKILIDAPNARF